MDFGILGLELSGKTTLFSLLTGHSTAAAPHKREAHVGIAHVPDPRLDRLTAMFKPKKHTPATVRFVDVPGVTKGGAQSLNLPELRQMDGLAVVVRGFASEAVPAPRGLDRPGARPRAPRDGDAPLGPLGRHEPARAGREGHHEEEVAGAGDGEGDPDPLQGDARQGGRRSARSRSRPTSRRWSAASAS